jgi:integral membrane protein
MSPRVLYRRIALAEAVTWGLLLLGMFFKYGIETTELGVKIFGPMHGVVFIAFCLITVVIWIDQRWSLREGLIGLASAVPPFLTIWWERRVEAAGMVGDSWRLAPQGDAPGNESERKAAERGVAALIARPAAAAVVGLVAVAALTALALVVGPPMKQG